MLDGILRALGVAMRQAQAQDAPPDSGRGPGGGVDIFVGGFLDDVIPNGAMSAYVKDYARQTGRPVQYYPSGRVGSVVNAIRDANRADGPVNVVGHSFGGPDAYAAVARANRQGLRVDNLITLDPVNGPSGRIAGQARPGRWMNVAAQPDQPDQSDRITGVRPFAHKPSALPTEQADNPVNVRLNHRDVEGMMQQSGARGLLDRSRERPSGPEAAFYSPPGADELRDNLPMMDWMRLRRAAAAGGRQ